MTKPRTSMSQTLCFFKVQSLNFVFLIGTLKSQVKQINRVATITRDMLGKHRKRAITVLVHLVPNGAYLKIYERSCKYYFLRHFIYCNLRRQATKMEKMN